jgi:tripartite-type tricarboxylate transporter receptor subunit TctC
MFKEKSSAVFGSRSAMLIIIVLIVLLFQISPLGGAEVNPDLEFYKDKVVTIVVPTKAGGGYDAYARMTARYLKKHLPGSTVIVKNVPGAGHIIGANEVYLCKPDGLTFGMGNFKGLLFTQIAGLPGIKFDLGKYSWLGNAASEPQVMIVDKQSPFKIFKDLKDSPRPVKMGASGVGSSSYNYSLMVGKIAGINFKMIPGFSGSEADMAMLRGEIDGQVGAFDNLRPMVESEGSRVVLVISKRKAPQFPNAPMISDFLTPANQGLINLMLAMAELGRPIAAPPKIPAGRLKVLRDAIDKTFKDQELLAYSQKVKLPINFASAEETRKMFVDALNQSPEVIKMVKDLAKAEN